MRGATVDAVGAKGRGSRRWTWSQTVGWAIAGPVVWFFATMFAYLYGGEFAFFGETNSGPERAFGFVATLVAGPALVAGPIAFGRTRPNRAVLVVSSIVAIVVSAVTYRYVNQQ